MLGGDADEFLVIRMNVGAPRHKILYNFEMSFLGSHANRGCRTSRNLTVCGYLLHAKP